MVLTAKATYQDNQTTINIKENDITKNVFFDVVIDGNKTSESEKTLIALALEEFAQQYIPEYAAQLTNNKVDQAVEKAEQVVTILNTLIKSVDLSDEAKKALATQYPSYEVGKAYKTGDVINYNDTLLEVVQDHTSQEDWKPDSTASLYKAFINAETTSGQTVVADFKQPTGAQDTYKKGDKVTFNGKVYESLVDNNVYSPAEYPQGWSIN